jgi:ribose transport system substrate-binding protein
MSIGKGIERVVKHYGGTYEVEAPTTDNVVLQVPILRDVIASHPTAIIMNTDSGAAVAPLVTQAETAGIPVFQVNSDIPNFAVPVQGVIGYSQFQTDYIIGKYSIKLRDGKSTQVGVLAGAPDYFSVQRVLGFVTAAHTARNFHIVSTLYGQWTTAASYTAAVDMLTAHPNIKVIFAANDYEIYGAYEAAKALHIKGLILLGSDGDTSAGLVPLAAGQITATMNTVPFVMGETAMQVTYDCLTHQYKGGDFVQTPGILTTKANILPFLCNRSLMFPEPTKTYACKL